MSKILLADGRLLQTHDANQCLQASGLVSGCAIHDPSDHPLRSAPFQWHQDIHTLYRVCEHGIQHPDPDDLSFKSAMLDFMLVEAIYSVHISECDGCCQGQHHREPHLTTVK